MSKKKERIQKLIKLHTRLNSPVKGASTKAEYVTYDKALILDTIEQITELLKEDGVFPQ